MSVVVDWDVPFTLISPKGTLYLNQVTGDQYIFDATLCSAGPTAVSSSGVSASSQSLRATVDAVPQGDGAIVHRSFKSYYAMKLEGRLFFGNDRPSAKPACAADLQRMWDRLMLHLAALVRPSDADLNAGHCRIIWTPPGTYLTDSTTLDARMLDKVKLLEWPLPTFDESEAIEHFAFALHTQFPYAIDLTLQTTTIPLAPVTVVNKGTADFHPVFHIVGPCTYFELHNDTSGLEIVYDAGLPGAVPILAGQTVEIDTFAVTINNITTSTDAMPGINVALSDFWELLQGSNTLHFLDDDAATCTMFWNNCWA
jgi:hypothetical protein